MFVFILSYLHFDVNKKVQIMHLFAFYNSAESFYKFPLHVYYILFHEEMLLCLAVIGKEGGADSSAFFGFQGINLQDTFIFAVFCGG